jgi:DNA ligase 1
MRTFAQTCEAIAATTKKLQKIALVADYLKSRSVDEAAISAVFFSGRAFPAAEETTMQVGGRLLWSVIADLSEKAESALSAAYRQRGDLGAVAADVLPEQPGQGISILVLAEQFHQVAAARGPAAKTALVRELLAQATPLEAKYIVKIVTGDLRIGLKESLVEEAIAKAYGSTHAEVLRANMLLGDIGETLRLAAIGKLAEAKMRIFHPLGFMLASPIESPEEGLNYFADAAVEDKYDGIRAQAHVSSGEVKIFSRTRDEITESFPELPDSLATLPQDVILDGEIVAWEFPTDPNQTREVIDESISEQGEERASELGHARPFSILQQRLGRKKVSGKMLRDVPVAFLVFDVLHFGETLLIDSPLRERMRILDELFQTIRTTGVQKSSKKRQGELDFGDSETTPAINIIRAPVFRAASPDELDQLFTAAQARGNEGLMIKDLNSTYTPGKRGKSWLKMKRELATLDVVVTAVEYGHGKRIGVLSDYTFAVWDAAKDNLVNIGKAYSGLTDAEIAEMTHWFADHTLEDQGFRRIVEPKIVLEVAFNNMMRSDRHDSGYALRFPRIVRLRPDKLPEEADTIETVREIFERQNRIGA